MKINKLIVPTTLTLMLISFFYGAAFIKFKIFPYQVIKNIDFKILNTTDTRRPYYYHKKSLFEQYKNLNVDVVFVGDSLTDFADWQELLPGISLVNRGIAGDTSSGVIERMDSILSTNAKCAFIMLGINDIAQQVGADITFDNYKQIVEVLTTDNTKVFIQSTLYAGKAKDHLNGKVKALNKKLEMFSNENALVTYIDINDRVSPRGYLDVAYSQDAIHLNGKGYLVWKSVISKYLFNSKASSISHSCIYQ